MDDAPSFNRLMNNPDFLSEEVTAEQAACLDGVGSPCEADQVQASENSAFNLNRARIRQNLQQYSNVTEPFCDASSYLKRGSDLVRGVIAGTRMLEVHLTSMGNEAAVLNRELLSGQRQCLGPVIDSLEAVSSSIDQLKQDLLAIALPGIVANTAIVREEDDIIAKKRQIDYTMSLSASVASESAPSAIERVPGTEAMASEAEPQTGVRERLLRKKPWRLTAQGKLRLEQKKATADLAQQFGCDLQWQHVPKDIYSGMPYKTLFELVREGLTSYREQYIGDLVRDGIISEARRIGGCIVFPPTAVAQIRNREERSKTGKLRARNGGRTPGSDKRQVDLSRRSRSA